MHTVLLWCLYIQFRCGLFEKVPIKTFCVYGMLKDPFGNVIKKIMDEIHEHADLKPPCEPGTQNYEQWVVQKEQNGEFTAFYKDVQIYGGLLGH